MPVPIYLDNNATTRPLPEVVETVARHLADDFANPGSRHEHGRRARRVLEESRELIADVLGASPDEVVFTSGGTESSNLVIRGLVRGESGIVATTAGEHPATANSCRDLERRGTRIVAIDVDGSGRLDEESIARLPWDELQLVTVIHAHNETGVVQDVRPLAEWCARFGVPLHLDAVQSVGKIPFDFGELGAAAASIGAHKFHGPRGIGALLLRRGVELRKTVFGGEQESGRRPGTECVALAAGMAKALELWRRDRESRTEMLIALRDRLESGLAERCAPVVVIGAETERLPNTAKVAFVGLDGESLLVGLDLAGICCSLGSTCASGASEASPALAAMGLPEEVSGSAVRFSVGIENTPEEIETAIDRIAETVNRLRAVRETSVEVGSHP